VGLSCKGLEEEELLALFVAIEMNHFEQVSDYCSNLGKKVIED
jgi:hypothetical protein